MLKILAVLLKEEEATLRPCDCDISSMSTTNIPQLDGNQTLQDDDSILLESLTGPSSGSSTDYFTSICETCNLTLRDRGFFYDHNSYQYYCSTYEIFFKTIEDSND